MLGRGDDQQSPGGAALLRNARSGRTASGGGGASEPPRPLWLDAWSDPVAGVSAFSGCIHTCNLFGDGDWRLVIADSDLKLKVCGRRGGRGRRTQHLPGTACVPLRRRQEAAATPEGPTPTRGARRAQVWKGTARASEHALLEPPVALTSFVPDGPPPRSTVLAVAAGCHVYMYRGLRPFYKFALPPLPSSADEEQIWCARLPPPWRALSVSGAEARPGR
jgi:Bardet-Biedl syndrome 1 protein